VDVDDILGLGLSGGTGDGTAQAYWQSLAAALREEVSILKERLYQATEGSRPEATPGQPNTTLVGQEKKERETGAQNGGGQNGGATDMWSCRSEEERDRERMLNRHWENRLQQAHRQVHVADGVAVRYQTETLRLQRLIEVLVRERDDLQSVLMEEQSVAERNKDDLDTARRNYEEQIKRMSEFIIESNGKLKNREEKYQALINFKVPCPKCGVVHRIQQLVGTASNGNSPARESSRRKV